jgi:hypothetical protein
MKRFLNKVIDKIFEGAPETMEPEGDYQLIIVGRRIIFRNIETGKIAIKKINQ